MLKSLNTDGTWNGNSYTWRGITYTILTDDANNVIGYDVDGTATVRGWLFISDTDLGNVDAHYNGSSVQGYIRTSYNPDFVDNVYMCFYNGGSKKSYILVDVNVSKSHDKWYPIARLSTESDPTFEPYENICPISGHTQAVVGDDGKNRFNPNSYESFDITGRGVIRYGHEFDSGEYTLINNGTGNTAYYYRIVAKDYSSYGSSSVQITNNTSVNVTVDDAHFLRVFTGTWNNTADNIAVIEGTNETFVPYNGYQITVNLGGTYYSGILDVVTGVFTPDKTGKDMTTITDWNIDTSAQRIYKVLSDIKPTSSGTDIPNLISNRFKAVSVNSIYSYVQGVAVSTGSALQFHISGLTDRSDITLAEVNQWFVDNPTLVVYELANPTPIQLSPTTIKALVGENHLSAPLEGQEITESKYRQLFTYDDIEPEAYKIARDTAVSIVETNAAYNSVKYSTSSHKVGKWVNGTDLIETTYIVNSGIIFGGTFNYISLPSYYKVRDYKGFIARTTGALDGFIYGYQGMSGDDISALDIRPSNIEFSVQSALQTNFEYVSITIQYTVDL